MERPRFGAALAEYVLARAKQSGETLVAFVASADDPAYYKPFGFDGFGGRL